jgi:hypothetical protein
VARPKKEIDPEKVETLAGMGLSAELIAAVLGCDHHTIERRFAPILKKGRQKRDGRLMVKLYQEALGTPCNTAIAIFLAKNWLGMATGRTSLLTSNRMRSLSSRSLTA